MQSNIMIGTDSFSNESKEQSEIYPREFLIASLSKVNQRSKAIARRPEASKESLHSAVEKAKDIKKSKGEMKLKKKALNDKIVKKNETKCASQLLEAPKCVIDSKEINSDGKQADQEIKVGMTLELGPERISSQLPAALYSLQTNNINLAFPGQFSMLPGTLNTASPLQMTPRVLPPFLNRMPPLLKQETRCDYVSLSSMREHYPTFVNNVLTRRHMSANGVLLAKGNNC